MDDDNIVRENAAAENAAEDKTDYSEYDNQKYEYVVGYQKKQKEKREKESKLPKWVQGLITTLIGLAMIAAWLFAYAWSLSLH